MNKTIIAFTSLSIMTAVVLESCTKEDEEVPTPTVNEFIADDNSFAGFENWTLEATHTGAAAALQGLAHGGNDSTVTRKVYFKDGQAPVSGAYPVGTLIAKHVMNASGTLDVVVGMAKRGNNYNASGGDWEYFILESDGKIAINSTTGDPSRGFDLNSGGCNSCHSGATTDYVFTK